MRQYWPRAHMGVRRSGPITPACLKHGGFRWLSRSRFADCHAIGAFAIGSLRAQLRSFPTVGPFAPNGRIWPSRHPKPAFSLLACAGLKPRGATFIYANIEPLMNCDTVWTVGFSERPTLRPATWAAPGTSRFRLRERGASLNPILQSCEIQDELQISPPELVL
jgi:hypothetical protein